jgi:NAD(P)-dependent dehydrogenase (short-subunit alcohol dehydrogenase family)
MQRVALITGATRGIGHGLFQRLISAGVDVATVYHRDEAAADRFRKDAKDAGVRTVIERLDVQDLDGLPAVVQSVADQLGRIDYLVNNVGIDIFKPVSELSLAEWRSSQDVILNAPFVLCKHVIPIMWKQRSGRIINIGASSKDYTKGTPGLAAFGVHKGALALFTKTLALEEMSNGITVNMVAPGSTQNAGTLPEEQRIPVDRIPIGRRVEIEEVVEAVMYFLSEKAASVTGQVIGVNGGLST